MLLEELENSCPSVGVVIDARPDLLATDMEEEAFLTRFQIENDDGVYRMVVCQWRIEQQVAILNLYHNYFHSDFHDLTAYLLAETAVLHSICSAKVFNISFMYQTLIKIILPSVEIVVETSSSIPLWAQVSAPR